MITAQEILMNRDAQHPLTPELHQNLAKLLEALNKFRTAYGKPMRVTSGYRPAAFNKAANGVPKSLHMVCLACDFADPDRKLSEFCLKNLQLLEDCGLWLEHPDHTPTWTHLQAKAPKSGKRVFRP